MMFSWTLTGRRPFPIWSAWTAFPELGADLPSRVGTACDPPSSLARPRHAQTINPTGVGREHCD